MKTVPAHIEKVSFHGDMIEVARIGDEGFVNLKSLCESIGVDVEPQRKKLRTVRWGQTVMMTGWDETGRRHRLAMISLRAVPMLLATIHPSKVAFSVRMKLEAYQLEAAMVLDAWFNGPKDSRLERMAELDQKVESLLAKVESLEEDVHNSDTFMRYERKKRLELAVELKDVKTAMDKVTRPFQEDGGEYLSVRDFCTKYNVLDENGRLMPARRYSAIGKRLTAMSNQASVPIHYDGSPWVGKTTNAYRMDILVAWRIDLDFRNRVTTKAYAKFHQPRLFAS